MGLTKDQNWYRYRSVFKTRQTLSPRLLLLSLLSMLRTWLLRTGTEGVRRGRGGGPCLTGPGGGGRRWKICVYAFSRRTSK